MSEAGIIILPRPSDANEEASINDDAIPEPHSTAEKSSKPEILHSELFDPNDSWYDAPPEGFNLTVRSFFLWMYLAFLT